MTFNILRNALIRNDRQCRHDNNLGFEVVWDTNDDFEQYEEAGSITTQVVWDRAFTGVATSGTCFIGPTTNQVPIDAGIYHLVRPSFRIDLDSSNFAPTKGRIQFQTNDDPSYDDVKVVDFDVISDNAYHQYTVDMSQIKPWQGQVIRIRIFPFIDGDIGTKVHFKKLDVISNTQFTCDTSFNGPLCDRFIDYSHPCPFVGAGGSCKSIIVNDGITITAGVNDRLLVNINGYGDQAITLTPVKSARLKDIAGDIEEKISNVAIGGYAGAIVNVALNAMTIIADDTRELISTVVVADSAASRTLGFFDNQGNAISTCLPGEDAASRYEPAGTIQLSRSEISHLYSTDVLDTTETNIELDSDRFTTQAGRSDFANTFKDRKVDAIGKTVIDFNNPVSNNGIITDIMYTGDGNTTTKFKFFRPKADGRIEFITEASMGILANGELNRVYENTVSVSVRKGDFIGIFDARIDAGKSEEFPNNSYFIIDGDFTGTSEPLVITGRGEAGLKLFAHGVDREDEVVLNIEFEQRELIEDIQIVAEEDTRQELINLSHAKGGGINGGPVIEDATGIDKFGDQAPPLTDLGALTDGVTRNVVGALAMHPSWLDSPVTPADKFDQTEFSFALDFAKGVPVFFDIFRVIMYFRDTNNIKHYQLEYPVTTDATDTNRFWGPVTDRFNKVSLEGRELTPTDHPLYENPIHVQASDFVDAFSFLEYFTLDFEFDSVRARSIRFNVKNFFFETNVLLDTLSDNPLSVNPFVLEMEVYAVSEPKASIADNFFFESSDVGGVFVRHSEIREVGSTSVEHLIGYPVKFLRLHIIPQSRLLVKSVLPRLSRSSSKILTNADEQVVSLNFSKKDFVSSEIVKVTNDSTDTFNYFIDIAPQRNPVERLLLWNKMGSDTELEESEIGPGGASLKRLPYFPREFNYSVGAPGFVSDPLWLLNKLSYITYDHGVTWVAKGGLITDYSDLTSINSVSPTGTDFLFTFVIIDLGSIVDLDTIQVINSVFGTQSFFSLTFSDKDTSDPNDLDPFTDFTGQQSRVRWIRLVGLSRIAGDIDNPPETVSFIRASLSLDNPKLNKSILVWKSAPSLTNFKYSSPNNSSCGEGWGCPILGFNNYYAVDLGDSYEITNIAAGPSESLVSSSDVDFLSAGGSGSLFTTSSTANLDIAYSNSQTTDVNNVNWGKFGDAPGVFKRWILIRAVGDIHDEVIVNINGNIQSAKPPFASARLWDAQLGTPVQDKFNIREGFSSVSLVYAANQGPTLETMELTHSLGTDHLLARRDFLRILFYISDITQFDTSQGHFAVGRNTSEGNKGPDPSNASVKDLINYYQWDFSNFSAGTFASGWNELFLPFTDNFRIGQPYLTQDDLNLFSSSDTSGKKKFRWFRLVFTGKQNNDEFTINLDGIRIDRAKYLPVKFGNGIYLTGNEYIKFPVHNFDPLRGTIEFFIDPDWTKSRGCFSCQDPKDRTIFRFFNSDGYVLGLFMTGRGLRAYVTDGSGHHYYLTDGESTEPIITGEVAHIAVAWDLEGTKHNWGLAIYINNIQTATFEREALFASNFRPNSDVTLMFGGLGWEGVINTFASSADGVIDNLKVYNYPITDFSFNLVNEGIQQVRSSDELIEISSDNVTFVGNTDRGSGLPLLIRTVGPGDSFNVYVRNKDIGALPEQGQERISYLTVIKAVPG